MSDTASPPIAVAVHAGRAVDGRIAGLAAFDLVDGPVALSRHPRWLAVLQDGLGHDPYALEATVAGQTCGFLPLAHVKSLVFGRFLVSLPYLNSNGVVARSAEVESHLVSRAVRLADDLGVRHLELRHEAPSDHPALNGTLTNKVHMRLALPGTAAALWKTYDPKVRNQVRKGEKNNLAVAWGGEELLAPFYDVLAQNMRDLGTPVYGRRLFRAILKAFPGDAELCVVRTAAGTPVAAALLLHGAGVTEVPTASSLREYNPTCANMLMYRHLLDRAVGRGQRVFDFGRSTADGPTYKFKKQWGAEPHPATWQYYVRRGTVGDMRPDNPRYRRVIRVWQKLPVGLTRAVGPWLSRGIP